jgi:hypothetical protein
MTNPTSNFGWQMPTSTDLVTDLPADFEVFGQAVDTSLADLKGGTTGQSLTKNSNTDMDFVWASAASGGMTSIASGTLSGASVVISSIPGTYIDLVLYITNRVHASANQSAAIRINGDTSTIYNNALTYGNDSSYTASQTIVRSGGNAPTTSAQSMEMIRFYRYADATIQKVMDVNAFTSGASIRNNLAQYCTTTAITSITILAESGNLTSGNYVLYGVK